MIYYKIKTEKAFEKARSYSTNKSGSYRLKLGHKLKNTLLEELTKSLDEYGILYYQHNEGDYIIIL